MRLFATAVTYLLARRPSGSDVPEPGAEPGVDLVASKNMDLVSKPNVSWSFVGVGIPIQRSTIRF